MANIKSAKKRIKVTIKKTLQNKIIKSRTKTEVKKLLVACKAGDVTAAKAQLPNTVAALDKAATKGIIHKNNASRKKSRLYKLVNRTVTSAK